MRAREFLAQSGRSFELRNLIKEKLSLVELKAIAERLGDPRALVATKKRAEAEAVPADRLLEWLAEDGSRLRRPIVDVGGKALALGFTAATREEIAAALR